MDSTALPGGGNLSSHLVRVTFPQCEVQFCLGFMWGQHRGRGTSTWRVIPYAGGFSLHGNTAARVQRLHLALRSISILYLPDSEPEIKSVWCFWKAKHAFPRSEGTLGGATETELDRVCAFFPKKWRNFKDNTGDFEKQRGIFEYNPCLLAFRCMPE